MPDKNKFYITTPIYYVNDVPHIGSSTTTIACDTLARYHRLLGEKVLFSTGTDENAPKVVEASKTAGQDPQSFVDRISQAFKDAWEMLNISNDIFIRTTEPRHKEGVQKFFKKLMDKGDIYKGAYEGWYCVPDETFWRESDLVDGKCPDCGREVQLVREENYFFRLSAYGDKLLEWIRNNPDALQPEFHRNEVISFIESGLRDACITRSAYGWGIEVPGDPEQVVYVWLDALINYITLAGYDWDEEKLAFWWPANVHMVGKDIFTRFHATLWPAMLMAAGMEPPKHVYAHGFWTVEGEKMSKSRGNFIQPKEMVQEIMDVAGCTHEAAVDALRYYLIREFPVGDSDFSRAGLKQRYNSDLANDLGNLLNRTLSMIGRYFNGTLPSGSQDEEIIHEAEKAWNEWSLAMQEIRLTDALTAVWRLIGRMNKYIDERAPWALFKQGNTEELSAVLYATVEVTRMAAVMVSPVMPYSAQAIWQQLGLSGEVTDQTFETARKWGGFPIGTTVNQPVPIFPRIEVKKEKKVEEPKKAEEAPKPAAAPAPAPQTDEKPIITFDDFMKLDLRVGEVKSAEKVQGADKLLHLTVDIGTETRSIVAGIAQWYAPEELVGKQIVIVANLAPRKMRGVESQGMLLAGEADGNVVVLARRNPWQPEQRFDKQVRIIKRPGSLIRAFFSASFKTIVGL
jgi:methionyl-tRNA synthetase